MNGSLTWVVHYSSYFVFCLYKSWEMCMPIDNIRRWCLCRVSLRKMARYIQCLSFSYTLFACHRTLRICVDNCTEHECTWFANTCFYSYQAEYWTANKSAHWIKSLIRSCIRFEYSADKYLVSKELLFINYYLNIKSMRNCFFYSIFQPLFISFAKSV